MCAPAPGFGSRRTSNAASSSSPGGTGAFATSSAWPRGRRNTEEGFFADPIYGGNKDKVGWKMIGFPGANPVLTPALALLPT